MLLRIQSSIYKKHIAILLVVSILSMSFKTTGNVGIVLNAGTPIQLETMNVIQSDMVSIGQTIDFKVKYDVKVDEKVVIAAGSIARGQVSRAQMARGLGREGFVEIQIKSVKAADGQEVFLTGGNLDQQGEDRAALAIVLGIFVCILFLTMKGKEAFIPIGYEFSSSVATNTTINI
jgi:hypothetical protein